jgi:hypothetical protein
MGRKIKMNNIIRMCILLSLVVPISLPGQQDKYVTPRLDDGTPWLKENDIKYNRLGYLAGTIIIADAIAIMKLKETWYNEKKGKFHALGWEDDIRRWKQMDKFGHTVHGAFASDLFSKALRLSGFSANNSIWGGSLMGWLWITQIEFADGFFERWGFSWGDLLGNTVGAGFSALRQFYPTTIGGMRLKVSYHISQAFINKEYYRQEVTYIDDYEGITLWLALNVYHVMPKSVQESYPVWLRPFGLAVGQSAKGVTAHSHDGYREVYLSLDIDLTKIPLGSFDKLNFVKLVKDELSFLKLPMPTIRFTSSGTTYVGFYF